ncbi:RidA family protein [Paraburkholderia sediminicola]|uniref:RidA family protein n=1 Tax=Paraburkholderia metrosideri TaxID=580937 RepID=A0ABW9E019_9BURK
MIEDVNSIFERRLAEMNLRLPPALPAQGCYEPWVVTGGLLLISGQGPFRDGAFVHNGVVGRDISVAQGYEAAQIAGLNLIAQVKAACNGDLGRVIRAVKLLGFVRSVEHFTEHPDVIDGASDLLENVFGACGKHSRSAIGVASLPFGICVEIEAIFQISNRSID